MILGSHNAWSYLRPKKRWMLLFAFTAKCQEVDIKTQYEKYGVRCFDLRLRFENIFESKDFALCKVVHGLIEYEINLKELLDDLAWLNEKGDVYVRILHDVRNKSQYKKSDKKFFVQHCEWFENCFPNIKFWCGKNLYDWTNDYTFKNNPSCEELYSSVCEPKLIDDLYPKLYAVTHNKKNIKKGTNKDILLIDFVNHQ